MRKWYLYTMNNTILEKWYCYIVYNKQNNLRKIILIESVPFIALNIYWGTVTIHFKVVYSKPHNPRKMKLLVRLSYIATFVYSESHNARNSFYRWNHWISTMVTCTWRGAATGQVCNRHAWMLQQKRYIQPTNKYIMVTPPRASGVQPFIHS